MTTSKAHQPNSDALLRAQAAATTRLLVMEGSARISVGNRTFRIFAGDFVVVPKGVRTALWLDKDARATLLVIETPAVDETRTVWLDGKGGKTGPR